MGSYTVRTLDGKEYPLSQESLFQIDHAKMRSSADRLEVVALSLSKLRSKIVEESEDISSSWQASFAQPVNTRMLGCSQQLFSSLTSLASIVANARDIATLVDHYKHGGK